MLCSKCKKNPASVFYKQVINGSVREAALCSQCASALNIGAVKSASGLSGIDLISGLFGNSSVRSASGVQRKVCPLCGSSFGEIAHSGKVGCAECYRTFRSELMPTVTGIHGHSRHTGRAPREFAPREFKAKLEEKNRIDELSAALGKAVAAEEYEEAARIRDEIKRLRDGGGNNNL